MAQQRRLRFALGTLLILCFIAAVRPWTIRPIETTPAAAFDAASYVEASWPRVLAEADQTARDVAAVLRPLRTSASAGEGNSPRQSHFVKGTGIVTNVELTSRVGRALVRLDGTGPAVDVAIQLGPVLRGTAVRDAVSFIRFTDFANQFDFAAVSNALNARILAAVLAPLDRHTLSGQRVSFVGAAAFQTHAPETRVEIVPIRLSAARGDR